MTVLLLQPCEGGAASIGLWRGLAGTVVDLSKVAGFPLGLPAFPVVFSTAGNCCLVFELLVAVAFHFACIACHSELSEEFVDVSAFCSCPLHMERRGTGLLSLLQTHGCISLSR